MRPLRSPALLEGAGADRVRVAAGEHRGGVLGLARAAAPRRSARRCGPSSPCRMRMAPWGSSAIWWASSSARSSDLPSGTTSLARPIRSASSAPTGRPVMISSIARAVADHQRQPHGHPVAADDVPAPLQRPEYGVLSDDPDVGEEGVLEAGRHRPAVDRGDHRLEDIDPAGVAAFPGGVVDAGPELVPVGRLALAELGGVLQIPARAEGLALAGDHQDEVPRDRRGTAARRDGARGSSAG